VPDADLELSRLVDEFQRMRPRAQQQVLLRLTPIERVALGRLALPPTDSDAILSLEVAERIEMLRDGPMAMVRERARSAILELADDERTFALARATAEKPSLLDRIAKVFR
jgi:hypothetical protein